MIPESTGRKSGSDAASTYAADFLTPLGAWCKENGISIAYGYKLARDGRLVITKVGAKAVVRNSDGQRFIANLPRYDMDDGVQRQRARKAASMRQANQRINAEINEPSTPRKAARQDKTAKSHAAV